MHQLYRTVGEKMAHFFTFAKTALKNLISKPVTTQYPDAPIDYPVRSRGHIEIDIDQCISCSLCVRNCPTECLAVDKNAGTWTINRFDCIVCGDLSKIAGSHGRGKSEEGSLGEEKSGSAEKGPGGQGCESGSGG